jgi:hypothetical protein
VKNFSSPCEKFLKLNSIRVGGSNTRLAAANSQVSDDPLGKIPSFALDEPPQRL